MVLRIVDEWLKLKQRAARAGDLYVALRKGVMRQRASRLKRDY
jgi:hypothetical protein